MQYEFTAIRDEDVPRAGVPLLQHMLQTYASETNKTASMWHAVPETLLDFSPHPKTNSIRVIFSHQILSERRFFAEFVGLEEPDLEHVKQGLDSLDREAYLGRYVALATARLPQLATADAQWWQEEMDFFGVPRQRIWSFWRRVLHTCHHRTQVQTWLRLAGQHVPAVYGPSGDVSWDGATPTYL